MALGMNELAWALADAAVDRAAGLRLAVTTLANGSRVIDAGIAAEGGFGAGVSGYLVEKQQVTDPVSGQTLGTVPKMSFGAARVWDLSVGVRFP